MRRIWIERKNIELGKKGVIPYNALDYLPKARAAYEREVLKKPWLFMFLKLDISTEIS